MKITVVDWNTDFCLYENFLGEKSADLTYVAGVLDVNIENLKSVEQQAKIIATNVFLPHLGSPVGEA